MENGNPTTYNRQDEYVASRNLAYSTSSKRVFFGGTVVKNLSANAGDSGDAGLIPGSGRSPGERKGNPFQYSCLQNPMDRGTWRAIVHGVAKSRHNWQLTLSLSFQGK